MFVYELEQVLYTKFDQFHQFLLGLSFHGYETNTFSFIYRSLTICIYNEVYINNIVVTGNYLSYVIHLVARLRVEFSIQDLGHLNYYLSIKVQYGLHGFLFS